MDVLLVVLAMLLFCWCAVVVLVRRAVRGVRRRMQALRERAELTARAHSGHPTAEAARLRRDLERSLHGARRALAAARTVQAPVGDVPSLLARLELAARGIDAELRMVEAQPDQSRIPTQLAGPRSRARAVIDSASALVDGLLASTGHAAEDLSMLQAACGIEAEALRAASRSRRPEVWGRASG
jgi:hypothetical protein